MILPRRIYDLGLSHKAVAVYCYLANRADINGGMLSIGAQDRRRFEHTQKYSVSCIYGT